MTRLPRPWALAVWTARLAPLVVLAAAALFLLNGLVLADRETPIQPAAGPAPAPPAVDSDREARVLAYNVGRLSPREGVLPLAAPGDVRARLDRIAEIIKVHRPDVVFLNEAVWELGAGGVDSVRYLARAADLPFWAAGENYNFGLPFFRIAGGNAILSRAPLTPLGNPDLAGRKPFWVVRHNHRILWCQTRIGGRTVRLGAVHADGADAGNNLVQTWQILGALGPAGGILAGDFNTPSDGPSIGAVRRSGRFSGVFNGPPTYPAENPTRTTDYIFAPSGWTVVDHRVIPTTASDHLPVFTVFRLPAESDIAPGDDPAGQAPRRPRSSGSLGTGRPLAGFPAGFLTRLQARRPLSNGRTPPEKAFSPFPSPRRAHRPPGTAWGPIRPTE
jgi:endonuclease/exonuclease/phosphatase family metal-dependent hydrolase